MSATKMPASPLPFSLWVDRWPGRQTQICEPAAFVGRLQAFARPWRVCDKIDRHRTRLATTRAISPRQVASAP